MLSSVIKAGTRTKYVAPGNNTKSKKVGNGVAAAMTSAFAAQRLELANQPSSSQDPRLIALEKLEQRGFKPALGGLEIPVTGKAMGGMPPRRVSAPRVRTHEEIQAERAQIVQRIAALQPQAIELRNRLSRPITRQNRRECMELASQIGTECENLIRRISELDEELR